MRTITVTEKYRAVNEGRMSKTEFVRQMRQSYPMYISPVGTYDSTVQILKNKNMLFEEKEQEIDDTFKYSDDSLRRALDIELEVMGLMSHGNISMDDQVKAKKKAVANLKKDPLHYYHLISGDSSKVNKHDKEVEVKRGALEKDTFNDMKKATLKERKERLVEGTRALVGFLSGDRLTTTYNHYDGYPSHLGKALQTHYNDDEKAKDIAMKGYITGIDADTGEVSATHKEKPGKLVLPDDKEQRAREIGEEIDSYGAEYGYVWDDNTNQWITIKNTGIRSMIDQILDKLDMVNVHSGDTMEAGLEETEEEYLAKKDAAIKQAMGKEDEVEEVIELPTLKETLGGIVAFLKSKGAGNDSIKDFIKTHKDDIQGMDMDSVEDEYNNFLSVNTDYIDEKKGKDHDGDGDVDGDDYMHAKDKAIKKAMGKDVNEDLTVVGHTPEEEKKNAEELVAAAKKAGRDAKIKYDGDQIKSVDIGAPGLGTPAEVRAVQDRQFADYDKNKPKDTKASFKAKKLKKLTVGGKTYEKGDFDPNDDGRIMSIEKYPNGYYIQGGIYSDYGDGDGPKEGYGYAIDLKGNEMDEEDLEGMYEGKKPNVNEAVKNIITKVLEEQIINEAATNDLAKIADEYGDFEGLKPAVIALENIVTEIESFYDKTRSKIQKVYNDLGEVRNEEGLKVGAFIAPSIENAFKRDLKPIIKNQFHGGLDMPQVKRISQADVDKGYIQQEAPKETVFTPVKENK